MSLASARFEMETSVLLAYRAVYALLTSNVYSTDGKDGHYRWCVEMLNRPEIGVGLRSWG